MTKGYISSSRKNDNESFKIKRSKSGSAYVNASKMFTMNDIDKKERVGRYRLEPVKGIEYYKGFHALEWVSDPTLKKKDTKDFEEEVEKSGGGGRKRFATKVGI